jgi:hypothetical protein
MICSFGGARIWFVLGLWAVVGLGGACDNDTGVGSGVDASGNHNNPHADASLIDAALTDATAQNDAQMDAFVRPPGDAYVLPENSHDAFVHPANPFGPAMVLDTLEIQNAADGLGPFAGVVNPDIQDGLDLGALLIVIEFLDLSSTTGVINDPDVTLVMYSASDTDADPSNNFSGTGQLTVDVDTATVITGVSITNGAVMVPAGSFQYLAMNMPGLGELVIMDPELSFQVSDDFAAVTDGEILGAVPSRTLDLLSNQTTIGNPAGTVLDLLAASIFNLQPNVDVDGDGQLEIFEDQSPNSPALDESISICYDYFGVFEDDGCPQYPEFWDGYSVGMDFTAVPCIIAGATP